MPIFAAASRANSAKSFFLSVEATSIFTSAGARKSAIFMVLCWRSTRRAQSVADAGFGQDIVRPLRIGLDLLPQLPDVNPQILRVGQIVPQLAEQEFVGEYLAGMLYQDTQQVVFLRRQFYLLVAGLDDAADQIDRKIADPEDRPLAVSLQLVAQRRPHPGKKLVHAERFCHIIVGAEIELLHLAGLVAAAGQHDDGNALVAGADGAQQVV